MSLTLSDLAADHPEAQRELDSMRIRMLEAREALLFFAEYLHPDYDGISAPLPSTVALAARERAEAFSTAGHAPECNGIDELNHRCACGFLQAEGGHRYLLALESRAVAAEASEGDLALLRHAVYRNHPPSDACAGCADIDKALSEGEGGGV